MENTRRNDDQLGIKGWTEGRNEGYQTENTGKSTKNQGNHRLNPKGLQLDHLD